LSIAENFPSPICYLFFGKFNKFGHHESVSQIELLYCFRIV